MARKKSTLGLWSVLNFLIKNYNAGVGIFFFSSLLFVFRTLQFRFIIQLSKADYAATSF